MSLQLPWAIYVDRTARNPGRGGLKGMGPEAPAGLAAAMLVGLHVYFGVLAEEETEGGG